jgi:PAS domain S-box-containing protein
MSRIHHWRIRSKLLLTIAPLVVLMTAAAAYGLHLVSAAQIEKMLTKRAESVALQIMADRQYYASVIVPRLAELGGVLDETYQQAHGRFPLPATYLREVSEYTATHRNGFRASLISPWPINTDKGVVDQFERDAFAYLSTYPNGRFERIERLREQTVLRFMTADRAIAQSCVDCHNAHPRSPRRDFKLNDVMGGLEITFPVDEYILEARRQLLMTVGGGFAFLVLFIGIVDWATRRTVTGPLHALLDRMEMRLKMRDVPSHLEFSGVAGNEMDRFEEAFRRIEETMAAQQAEIKKQQDDMQRAHARLEQRLWDNTKALEESERRFRNVLDLIPDALFYVNPLGVIQAVNAKAEDQAARTSMEMVGLALRDLLSPDSAGLAAEVFEALARGEELPPAIPLEVVRSTGGVARLSFHVATLRDDDHVLGHLFIGQEPARRGR